MGFLCAPQLMGLVRGEPKSGQKHRANGRAILAEAGDARVSQSVTLDRTRSRLNKYTNYTNGFQAWDEMEKQATEYQTTFTDKNGVTRKRKLKSDAVCGYAVIFNPPEEECSGWTDAQYEKFYADSWRCLCEIEPRLFSDKNVLMSAEHFDEGIGDNDRHLHKFGIPKDENDKYCGNLLDAKLLSNINQNYPAMMRQHGWDMDDLDTTDWDLYKTDVTYRCERKKKLRKSGKSVNKHIADKTQDDYIKAQEMLEQASKNLAESEAIRKENEDEKKRNEADAEQNAKDKKMNEDIVRANLKKSMELRNREAAINKKEREQQEKEDKFQQKEDAQDAQQRALREREQRLDERDVQQNKRERVLQAQEHFQDVNRANRANRASVHSFDEYGNRV